MPSRGRPVASLVLRAAVLGASAVGAYLLLNLSAGPASADQGTLGGLIEAAAGAGDDQDGLLDGFPLPGAGSPAAPVDSAVPAADPEPAEREDRDRDREGDGTNRAIAAEAPAGEPVDQLVTALAAPVESTVGTLMSTVDSTLPGVRPVVEGLTEVVIMPALPGTGSLAAPITTIAEALLPHEAVPTVPARHIETAAARDGPDLPRESAAPRRLPPSWPATSSPPTGVPAVAVAAIGAAADDPWLDPLPGLPQRPLPSTHQLSGKTFDAGNPWSSIGPSYTSVEPEHGLLRCFEDASRTALVMPISAPPG